VQTARFPVAVDRRLREHPAGWSSQDIEVKPNEHCLCIEATRELCADLDKLIELTKVGRAPVRALSLIERLRADLQAYLDEIERTSSGSLRLVELGLKAKK
jgi:hypothetical protein